MSTTPKRIRLEAKGGGEGIGFDRTGNMRKGTARITAWIWHDSFVASDVLLTEQDRLDLIALLQSGKGAIADE